MVLSVKKKTMLTAHLRVPNKPLYQSVAWCTTILTHENDFNLHVNEILFSYERMSTKTRFEKEAKSHLEIVAPMEVLFSRLKKQEKKSSKID